MLRRAPSSCTTGFALLLLGMVATMGSACATGVGGEDDDSGPSSGAGAASGVFTLQAPIDVMNAPEGYTIALAFDHGSLVADGKSLASGDDVRVEYDDGSGPVEIDRVLDDSSTWNTTGTIVYFRIQPGMGTYRLKYGNPDADAPPANPNQVFIYYDTFDGGALDDGWTSTAMGTAIVAEPGLVCPSECGLQQLDGTLRFRANTGTGDFGDVDASNLDNIAFLHREVTGAFIFETKVTAVSSNLSGASRVGGAMVRASTFEGGVMGAITRNALMGSQQVLTRSTENGAVTPTAGPDAMLPAYFRVQRSGASVSFAFSDNGRVWTNLGGGVALADDPALVGIPFANPNSGSIQSVDVDWVRIRLGFDAEPLASLGAEEAL